MVDTERIARMSARVVRIRARNPSPMTLEGTNTYLIDVGGGAAAVVDPGPLDPEHVDIIVETARRERQHISGILVTHGHPDHAPAAALLRERTTAPVYAHPDARFAFDHALGDDARVSMGGAVAIRSMHAPGHAVDHLVFWLEDDGALFSGDVVVGRGTVVVAPPGGDMRRYQTTLARLRKNYSHANVILGGHGPRIDDARAKLNEYIAHRAAREREIVTALMSIGPTTIPHIVARVYAGTPPVLWPVAARQVLAYLDALQREGSVVTMVLDRAPTAFEASLLYPDLSAVTGVDSVAVARAELGFDAAEAPIRSYRLNVNRTSQRG